MRKLSSFQKFCARFSLKLPGLTSILLLILSVVVAHLTIDYSISHRYDSMALNVSLAGVAFLSLIWTSVLIIFPMKVGSWKDRLPERAIKHARDVAEEFPEAAEALEDWIKVAIRDDDGTKLQGWTNYFEKLHELQKREIAFHEALEAARTEIEKFRLNKPE